MEKDLVSLAAQGGRIPESEAKRLEQHLQTHPDDVEARAQLIGYYGRRRFDSPEAREACQRHILWFIRNRPKDPFTGSGMCTMLPDIDGEAYYEARRLWLQQVDKHPKDTRVLINASNFLALRDRSKAIDLAKRALSLEPDNLFHAEKLALLYNLTARETRDVTTQKRYYRQALTVLEGALKRGQIQDIVRVSLLSAAADTAARAEEWKKAERYAQELLALASRPIFVFEPDADGIHTAHIVLGKVALRRGDVEAAKKHLLESARVSGSPTLGSFGPDFTLAKALLLRGEKQAVLEYLNLCERFWGYGKDSLKEYRRVIEHGGIPAFGFKGE